MRALLDVNVWIVLFDDAHQFSNRANLFIAKPGVKITTGPLVENGVMGVMSSPRCDRKGCLVSFDQGIALSNVKGAASCGLPN